MSKFSTLLLIAAAVMSSLSANAQKRLAKTWADEAEPITHSQRVIVPTKARTIQVNLTSLRQELAQVNVNAYSNSAKAAMPLFELPMPNGGTEAFRIWETSCMDPILAAKYPMIKTYSGQSVAHPEVTLTMDASPFGFHVVARFTDETVYIDPFAHLETEHYIVYNKSDFTTSKRMVCHNDEEETSERTLAPSVVSTPAQTPSINLSTAMLAPPTGPQLRSYRLALSGTAEYSLFHSPSQNRAQVLAAMVTSINRVNSVYERDIAVHFNLVPKNDTLIFFNATTDGFTNNSGSAMLNENQTKVDALIGTANYDMGHIFSTNGGGIAQLQSVCGSSKARGVTGTNSPVGDPFDIDYVVHEMGHQFGCNHTFNGGQGSCSGNRSSASAYEPGSGVTIMAYAGICGTDDIDQHSIDIFHTRSFDEATIFSQTGGGNSCAAITQSGNTTPTITLGTNTYTIPKNTPFALTAVGADADGDAITYCWEEFDLGATCAPNAATGTSPTFKPYNPTTSPTRYFPQLNNLLAGTTDIGNVLPNYARTMKFRCTVRDNRPNCGGSIYALHPTITVAATGPMLVTVPNTTGIVWPVGASRDITWDVASTNIAPVNCPNVRILLSTDGGLTFPNEIVASTPNTGTYTWASVGNFVSTTCRVKVEAVGNIFFDINNANFEIRVFAPDYTVSSTDTLKTVCAPGATSFTINSQSISNFSTPINYTVTGLPVGSTPSWTGNPATPGSAATLNLAIGATVAAGTYNLNLRGNAGGIIHNKIVKLIVASGNPTAVTALNTPGAGSDLVLPTNTGFAWTAVTGVTSYIVEVATDAAFGNIVATQTSTTANLALTTPLIDGTQYFWRVKSVSTCGTSASTGQAFTTAYTGCLSVSNSAPMAISGTVNTTATSTININSSYIIRDLNIKNLNITHPYISDISYRVVGPTGAAAALMPRICNDQDNFTNLTFDDLSTVLYNGAGCPPAPNSVLKPQQALSVFNGTNPTGNWNLIVTVGANGNGGTIDNWTVEYCVISNQPIATENVIADAQKVSVYPNPTRDLLNIVLDESIQKSTLNVFNMQGQLVHTQTGATNTTISTEMWAAGMYILQVKTADALLTRKFVVQK